VLRDSVKEQLEEEAKMKANEKQEKRAIEVPRNPYALAMVKNDMARTRVVKSKRHKRRGGRGGDERRAIRREMI
jgi:hypothetical protein